MELGGDNDLLSCGIWEGNLVGDSTVNDSMLRYIVHSIWRTVPECPWADGLVGHFLPDFFGREGGRDLLSCAF